jgi:dual specificity phosphatase 3
MDWSFITERVATGAAISTVADVDLLVASGVTAIVDARAEFDDAALIMASHPSVLYLWDGTEDDRQPKPVEWFGKALDFAMPILVRPGQIVFTHCAAGHNRGPSLAYAVLRAQGWYAKDAIDLIHVERPATIGGIVYAADADRALKQLGWTRS